MLRKRDTQGGFTLIELSIVLVIIGLLVGGVVKGQELIENARGNRLQAEFQGFETASSIHFSTTGQYPVWDTANNVQHATWNNLNNGVNQNFSAATTNALLCALLDRELVNGIAGDQDTSTCTFAPAMGSDLQAAFRTENARSPRGNVLRVTNVPGLTAQRIEQNLDNGNPDTGAMRTGMDNAAGTAATNAANAGQACGFGQDQLCQIRYRLWR